jgi:hypothetical protein
LLQAGDESSLSELHMALGHCLLDHVKTWSNPAGEAPASTGHPAKDDEDDEHDDGTASCCSDGSSSCGYAATGSACSVADLDGFSDPDSLVFSDDDVFSELAEDEFENAESCSDDFWFQTAHRGGSMSE